MGLPDFTGLALQKARLTITPTARKARNWSMNFNALAREWKINNFHVCGNRWIFQLNRVESSPDGIEAAFNVAERDFLPQPRTPRCARNPAGFFAFFTPGREFHPGQKRRI